MRMQKGGSLNCWQWWSNFSSLAIQTWLKFIWIPSVVFSGCFNTETQLEQEGREWGMWEGRHLFSSPCSIHPHRQNLPPILSLLTTSSGDLFLLIVRAATISYFSQQLSSQKLLSSDFLTFVSWSKHDGKIAWLLLRCSSLVLDTGAGEHWCWTLSLVLDIGHWYWTLVVCTGHRDRTTLLLDTGHCFWTQGPSSWQHRWERLILSRFQHSTVLPKATTHHTLGTPVPQGCQTAQARQFPSCIKPWGRRGRGKGNTETVCARPLVTSGLFTTVLCDLDWSCKSHLGTGEESRCSNPGVSLRKGVSSPVKWHHPRC